MAAAAEEREAGAELGKELGAGPGEEGLPKKREKKPKLGAPVVAASNVVKEEGPAGVPETGTQCSGRALMERYGKENGQQLSRAEGRRLAMGLQALEIKRPKPLYLIIKLMAEILEVHAEVELKHAALQGKPLDKRLAVFRILGSLNKCLVPASKQAELEDSKVVAGMEGLVTKEEETYLLEALAVLPKMEVRKKVETALGKKNLLFLDDVSELMYVLGKGLETGDTTLQTHLEHLSQTTPEKVIAEEDVDFYYRYITGVKGLEGFNHFLVYAPVLAEGHGTLLKGQVVLKRQDLMTGAVLPPNKDWMTIKVIAVLFDTLAHMKNAAERMVGPPGTRFQLGCLGGINRSFMVQSQKRDVLSGKRATLDGAELDALKELSLNSKHASINPKKHVARGGKKIQKHILENYIFNMDELVELFSDLAHRFFIPVELYRGMVDEMVKAGMLKKEDGKDILSKLSKDQKRGGIHMFNVAPLFTVKMELKEATLGPRGGESDEGASSESSGASGVESCVDVGGADVQVPVLLLHDFVILKKRGPRRNEFHMEAYTRAIEYLERAVDKADMKGDKKTALGYLKSAVERKRPLPLVELSFVISLLGQGKCIAKNHLTSLLDDLRRQKLVDKLTHDTLLSTSTPVSPTALRLIFDKLIAEHD